MLDSVYATWADATAPWILPLALVGIAATIVGIALLMWTGGRRFNRRNFAGVEVFSGYGDSLLKRLVEGLAGSIGGIVFTVGLFSLFAAGYALFLQRY
jgi:hypothetical protein